MVKSKKDELVYLHFTVYDVDGITPLTGQVGNCVSSLRLNGASAAEIVTILETGATGRYYVTFTPVNIGSYALEMTLPDDRVVNRFWETELYDLDDIFLVDQRSLGLNQENYYIDNTAFIGLNLTSARIRLYSVAGSVGTDNDVLATYSVTATYTDGILNTYRVRKV